MPSHKGIPPPKPSDFEKAVQVLLHPPNVDFMRDLLKHLRDDPQYLFYHELSIGLRIQRALFQGGINWDAKTILYYWNRALRVALERLRDG